MCCSRTCLVYKFSVLPKNLSGFRGLCSWVWVANVWKGQNRNFSVVGSVLDPYPWILIRIQIRIQLFRSILIWILDLDPDSDRHQWVNAKNSYAKKCENTFFFMRKGLRKIIFVKMQKLGSFLSHFFNVKKQCEIMWKCPKRRKKDVINAKKNSKLNLFFNFFAYNAKNLLMLNWELAHPYPDLHLIRIHGFAGSGSRCTK